MPSADAPCAAVAPQIFGGISAFNAGTAGQLYAALLVNGVQMIAT